MPNGEQALEPDQEGEDSAEESGEWESPDSLRRSKQLSCIKLFHPSYGLFNIKF